MTDRSSRDDVEASSSSAPNRSREPASRPSSGRWGWLGAVLTPGRAALALAACLAVIVALSYWLLTLQREHAREVAQLTEQVRDRDSALVEAQRSLDAATFKLQEAERRVEVEQEADSSEADEEIARQSNEIARLRRTIEELSRPQIGAPIVELSPARAPADSGGSAPSVDVPRTANVVTLVLNFTGELYPEYEVDILDERGRRMWRGTRTRQGDARRLTVTVSRRRIPTGTYRINLYGIDDNARRLVSDYIVNVVYR